MAMVYDTIVVGLGMAGVAALSYLAKMGHRVLGLEAAGRIGGRVHSVQFGEGIVELGAEWIHGTVDSPTFEIVEKQNIVTVPQTVEFQVFRSDGTEGDSALVQELLDYCIGVFDELNEELEPGPLGQYIQAKFFDYVSEHKPHLFRDADFMDQFLCFLNLLTNNYEASNDWNDVSIKSRYRELGGHQHMSLHRYGYATIFDVLMNTFNNGPGLPNYEIRLHTEVMQIIYPTKPGELVIVKCGAGADEMEFKSKNVIVTISLGVLKAKHETLFSPPLPKEKKYAIENIAMGVMDKVILNFDTEWWPKNMSFFAFIWKRADKMRVSEADRWTTQIFAASRACGCTDTLTLWTSGQAAILIETLDEAVLKTKVTSLLRKFMGNVAYIPEPRDMIRSEWYNNPLTRGSYSYDAVHCPPHARSVLAAPLCDATGAPRVMFAGEATNPLHYSTVHGAYESGVREAQRLVGGVQSKI